MVLVAERTAQQPQGSQQVPSREGGGLTTTMLTEGQEFEDSGPTTGFRTIQKPVYYDSEVLHEAKARYLKTHKLIYVVLVASRKLCHYFQEHRVVVMTSYQLRAILHNSNATGNIAKWATELAEFLLEFQPCHAVKIRSWLTSSWSGPHPRALLGVWIPIWIPHLRSPGLWSSPSPTGRSYLTDPPASRVAAME
jgi:hypothetical protein